MTLTEFALFALFVGLGVAGGLLIGFLEGARYQAPPRV